MSVLTQTITNNRTTVVVCKDGVLSHWGKVHQ
ncbi:hypothetical protein E2C01_031582 [Portunus trituberculatus]|uniref:Uncharacterized protein n=1 Tax=Portunus trituberculatus TaxID=210409 RepID=A0A5B7ETV1_PORTR|nr:hypothetical protein [Portunus trituberculatus]